MGALPGLWPGGYMTNDNTDTETDDEPFIVSLGAGERGAPESINLDVRGAPGPDHLGQQTADVDGHWADKPGVRSSLPEDHPDSPEVRRMDTGEELPVLLSSDMSADPIEGVQGTYTVIEPGECPRCGYDRLKVTVATLPGEYHESCMACGAELNSRQDNGYTMPDTREERADDERASGEVLVSLPNRDVVDLSDTGFGDSVSLVGDRSVTRLRREDVVALFAAVAEEHFPDPVEGLAGELPPVAALSMAAVLTPDGWGVRNKDDDEDDSTDD